ncbi:MAG: hypothetical protein ABIP85_15185, partial [Chthoniobacteraceae bacterium]
ELSAKLQFAPGEVLPMPRPANHPKLNVEAGKAYFVACVAIVHMVSGVQLSSKQLDMNVVPNIAEGTLSMHFDPMQKK